MQQNTTHETEQHQTKDIWRWQARGRPTESGKGQEGIRLRFVIEQTMVVQGVWCELSLLSVSGISPFDY
jgi:hypothetical protein